MCGGGGGGSGGYPHQPACLKAEPPFRFVPAAGEASPSPRGGFTSTGLGQLRSCPGSWVRTPSTLPGLSQPSPQAGKTGMEGILGILAGTGLALTFLLPLHVSCPDRGQGAGGMELPTPERRSPQSLSLVPTCPPGQMREGKEAGPGPGRRLMTLPGPNLRLAAAEWLRLAPGGG